MRLRDLDAEFVGRWRLESGREVYSRIGEQLEGAQGVSFQCPKCALGKEPGQEGGRRFVRGAHYVLCWFTNPRNATPVPDHATPVPGRWTVGDSCTGLDDLTFTGPAAASVLLSGPGCGWHGFIRNGEATLS
ncbi:MAG: hypothetical protein AB7G12_17485 [Thermoanaerobaculia bacterium]